MGVGLFILIVLWTVVIMTGLLTMQWSKGGPITAGTVVLASLVTIILILIPRGKITNESTDQVDEYFIPRITMLCVMSLSVILGGVFWFIMRCVQPIYAKQTSSLFHGINYGNYQAYKGS
ncbi:hypothetical protein ACHWQZ_G002928 [Mnemiopsis leidyi]